MNRLPYPTSPGASRWARVRESAFTIIELLVVVSIIALLIGLLVPSLQGARDQAKNVKTRAMLNAISTGLEMFKNDNEKEFRASNGYPPSARAMDKNAPAQPMITPLRSMYGAHWLVRHLMGMDLQGFVPKRNVPPTLLNSGPLWYDADVLNGGPIDRAGPYLDPDAVEVVSTNELPGQPDTSARPMDPNMRQQVILDVFGFPVLYYVANPFGRVIASSVQDDDPRGVYVQEDNYGFTGSQQYPGGVATALAESPGWVFTRKDHLLGKFGNPAANNIDSAVNIGSFCHYIVDRKVLDQTNRTGNELDENRTVRAMRSDSYLLITAGKDGAYGTLDDISNVDQLRQ
ncbi:MAG: hypothetical protein V3W34_06380 [Phycisphaerae bacterium]